MFKYKDTFLKYNHLCTIMSFNVSSINSSVWKVRNYIRYILFFIFKKICFLKLFILYKFFFIFLKVRMLLKLDSSFNHDYYYIDIIVNNFFSKYSSYIKEYYFSQYLIEKKYLNRKTLYLNYKYHLYTSINIIFYSKLLSNYNFFYFLYKVLIFVFFIWLYILKYLNFYKLKTFSIPIKGKVYNVLRSPHADSKSREKFKLKKIKKIISFPSFIGHNMFFFSFLNDSISVKHNISIKK